MLKKVVIAFGLLFLLAVGLLSHLAGGAKHIYGLVRYALPQMHRGELRVGDPAPDVLLLSLDGHARFSLREKFGSKPLVLIFGSYT
jgi:hypothetical protein